ncbi:MAG: hypothetical protein WCI27_03990 [Candidatus Omnitrophota bacterium]
MLEKLYSFAGFRKLICWLMAVVFLTGSVMPLYAQGVAGLSSSGMMNVSRTFTPPIVRGMTIDPKDPFAFKFLMDRGDDKGLSLEARTAVYEKLIKYFMASLAVPEEDVWVNLSPYEGDRLIADNFGMTVMGRDLLEMDYALKRVTASLFHPDQEPGKAFWKKVYQAAYERYGTTDVPVDTFNKVWIVPSEAKVYEDGNSVILVKSHLKVMLEQDYLAQKKNAAVHPDNKNDKDSQFSRDIVREVMIPILEKEVNDGENFAVLRQITASLILATWYKKAWKDVLLNQGYTDHSKVKGVDQDPANNQIIYNQYVEAFKQGAVNLVREEYDTLSQEMMPRKYFSGGYGTKMTTDDGQTTSLQQRLEEVSQSPMLDPKKTELVAASLMPTARTTVAGLFRPVSRLALLIVLWTGAFFQPTTAALAEYRSTQSFTYTNGSRTQKMELIVTDPGVVVTDVWDTQSKMLRDFTDTVNTVIIMSRSNELGALDTLGKLEARVKAGKASEEAILKGLVQKQFVALLMNGKKPVDISPFLQAYTDCLQEIGRVRKTIDNNNKIRAYNEAVEQNNAKAREFNKNQAKYSSVVKGYVEIFNKKQRDPVEMKKLSVSIGQLLAQPDLPSNFRATLQQIKTWIDKAENVKKPKLVTDKNLGGIDLNANSFNLEVESRKEARGLVSPVLVDLVALEGLSPRILSVTSASEYVKMFSGK